MGKILNSGLLKPDQFNALPDGRKIELRHIVKDRLATLGEYKLLNRKTIEQYTYDSECAKLSLIEIQSKNGFTLISDEDSILTFEK